MQQKCCVAAEAVGASTRHATAGMPLRVPCERSAASSGSFLPRVNWATYTSVFPSADQHRSLLIVAVWPATRLGIEFFVGSNSNICNRPICAEKAVNTTRFPDGCQATSWLLANVPAGQRDDRRTTPPRRACPLPPSDPATCPARLSCPATRPAGCWGGRLRKPSKFPADGRVGYHRSRESGVIFSTDSSGDSP